MAHERQLNDSDRTTKTTAPKVRRKYRSSASPDTMRPPDPSCPQCLGEGWIHRERNGISGSAPCACRRVPTDIEANAAISLLVAEARALWDGRGEPYPDHLRAAIAWCERRAS